jgi:hypothetical protein
MKPSLKIFTPLWIAVWAVTDDIKGQPSEMAKEAGGFLKRRQLVRDFKTSGQETSSTLPNGKIWPSTLQKCGQKSQYRSHPWLITPQ